MGMGKVGGGEGMEVVVVVGGCMGFVWSVIVEVMGFMCNDKLGWNGKWLGEIIW